MAYSVPKLTEYSPAALDAGIKTTHSGTASARIRFISTVKQGAKIVFSGTGIAWNSKGSYVDIDGFDISGSGRIGILADGSARARHLPWGCAD